LPGKASQSKQSSNKKVSRKMRWSDKTNCFYSNIPDQLTGQKTAVKTFPLLQEF